MWVVVAVLLSVGAEALAWRDVEPDALNAVALVVELGGLVALGAWAGARAALVVVPAFAVAALVEQAVVYEQPVEECDPFCSEPVVGIGFVLPFSLALVAVGAIARASRRARASR